MSIDFTEQAILMIYNHFKGKEIEIETYSNVSPNPIHKGTYSSQLKELCSITSKIETSTPSFLDETFQKLLRDAVAKKLNAN